tara:strand:- start:1124 stop:1717 length:594 start_codon:yes stop_codon:yes gene_type:complete
MSANSNSNSNSNNSQQNIDDFVENMQRLNRIGTQIAGTFTQMATPYVSEFCNNLATSVSTNINNTTDTAANATTTNSTTTFTSSSENQGQETLNKKKPFYKIFETSKTLNILVNLAGVEKKDINVEINNTYLHVYAKTSLKTDIHWLHLDEINYECSIPLNNTYDNRDLFVEYHCGILKIVVTKKITTTQDSKIEIN